MCEIRLFKKTDWPQVWGILEPVFCAGETYCFAPDISEQEAYTVWVDLPEFTYVAVDSSQEVIGSYYLKKNQPGLGSHVCNCGYVVCPSARGKGIATLMCKHSQQEAINSGYLAMQYNLVVSTNEGAIRLWLKLGFRIVGTLPEAFRHSRLGFVDAYVMYKNLKPDSICIG